MSADEHDDDESLRFQDVPSFDDEPANDAPKLRVVRGDELSVRPTIRLSAELRANVDAGIAALAPHPDVYQRDDKLVRVTRSVEPTTDGGVHRSAGTPTIRPIPIATLRELLADVATWERYDVRARKALPTLPSGPVVEATFARATWTDVRPLLAVSEAPTLRPDGSIVQTEGYDAATGLLYLPSCDFGEIPTSPTRDDADRACRELLKVIAEFPIINDAHRSAAIAAIVTPFARPAIDGCVPMFTFDASIAGTGKGLLANVGTTIFTGRSAANMTLGRDDEETEKRLVSCLMVGDPIITIDNVERAIVDASLASLLTSYPTWRGRVLGTNTMPVLASRAIIQATGTNIQLNSDIGRRTLPIRMEPTVENPEARTFAQPDLLAHVRANRPRLVRAVLTMLRAWFVDGKPKDARIRTWGSFEAWSNFVPHVLVWCGLADPMGARFALDSVDTGKNALASFIDGLVTMDTNRSGLAISAILRVLYPPPARDASPPVDARFDGMREAVETMAPPRGGKVDAMALGKVLAHARGRIIGGRKLESDTAGGNVLKWRVVDVAMVGGLGGLSGNVSTPKPQSVSDSSSRRSAGEPTEVTQPTLGGEW